MKLQMPDINPADTLITDTLAQNPAGGASSTGQVDTALKRIAHYDLRREIGRGAVSVVYEAVDIRTGEDVALKALALPPSLSPEEGESLIAGFEREARTMARFSHPNIVRLHEANPQQNRHFLVMEYLKGQTLQKRMSMGALTASEALAILTQIAGALDAVHKAGVIHRDVKPAHVMLLPDGTAKLLGFDMALSREEARRTRKGAVVGSPSYLAPEQIKGQPETAATDTWALGVLSYEMLAGHLPFTGLNVGGVLFQIIHQLPTPMPDLPPAVQEVLLRALDKRPSQRYATASAFIQALKLAQPRQAPAASKQKPAVSFSRPISKWLPTAALLGLFLLGFCWTALVRHQASYHAPKEAISLNPPERPGQSFVPASVPLRVLQASQPQASQPQASQPQASQPQAPQPDLLPVLAPAGLLVKVQAAPQSHPTVLRNASAPPQSHPTVLRNASAPPQLRKHPAMQITQTAAPVRPVRIAQTMSSPVQPRRPNLPGPTARRHVPAATSSHSAPRQIASQHIQTSADSRHIFVQPTDRPEPAQSGGQNVPAQSNDQTFTLPAGGGSYDPEADARLRKSAWSEEGSASHP